MSAFDMNLPGYVLRYFVTWTVLHLGLVFLNAVSERERYQRYLSGLGYRLCGHDWGVHPETEDSMWPDGV